MHAFMLRPLIRAVAEMQCSGMMSIPAEAEKSCHAFYNATTFEMLS